STSGRGSSVGDGQIDVDTQNVGTLLGFDPQTTADLTGSATHAAVGIGEFTGQFTAVGIQVVGEAGQALQDPAHPAFGESGFGVGVRGGVQQLGEIGRAHV